MWLGKPRCSYLAKLEFGGRDRHRDRHSAVSPQGASYDTSRHVTRS